jgi:hypothetical protein
MLVRISQGALLADLCAHFRRGGFAVEEAGGTTIEVSHPDPLNPELEAQEIELHLSAWRAGHPNAKAEVIARALERRGTITKLDADRATLTMEDGSEMVVTDPEMIYAEVGMTVEVVVTDDGTVTVKWIS